MDASMGSSSAQAAPVATPHKTPGGRPGANGSPFAALVMTSVLRRDVTRGRCVLKARLLQSDAIVLLLSSWFLYMCSHVKKVPPRSMQAAMAEFDVGAVCWPLQRTVVQSPSTRQSQTVRNYQGRVCYNLHDSRHQATYTPRKATVPPALRRRHGTAAVYVGRAPSGTAHRAAVNTQ